MDAQIGKMLVFESGAVKIQLGNVLFDVLPGTEAAFRQDVAVVDTQNKACVFLGGVQQHAVVTPDIEYLLRYCSSPHMPSPVQLLPRKAIVRQLPLCVGCVSAASMLHWKCF